MMVDDYEGALEIERAWREGLRPDPMLTVSEWADRHRVLSSNTSGEPGRWSTRRTPYLREIMDCLSPTSPIERVVFMKGAQVGGTELGLNWVGYSIHHAPGPMMIVWPTTEMAQRNSKHRIDPLIEESSVLKDIVAPPDGADKDTLLALAEAHDTIERGDVHPKQRALAMRRLVGGAAVVASRKAGRQQPKVRGNKP